MIRVVAAPPYYPDWRVFNGFSAASYCYTREAGVEVYRSPLWVPLVPSGVKRLLHLAGFALTSLPILILQILWRPQIVWVVAPAFFCVPGAWLAARLCSARCWLHVQDFEVDAAFELGLLKGVRLRRFALGVERLLLQRFDRVSSVSMRMVKHLIAKGVEPSRVVFFPNWVDTDVIAPMSEIGDARMAKDVSENQFLAELQIPPGALVALYSGNMGKKQGLEILAEAAKMTCNRSDLVWVFCGEGAGRGGLEIACEGLPNVRMLPLQPLERLNELLNLAAIHLLPQRAEAADLVMPSKLGGMLASGRPVVATSRKGTELEQVLDGCGLVVEPDSPAEFCSAVLALVADSDLRRSLGRAGRAYAETHLARDVVLAAFERELARMASHRSERLTHPGIS